MSTTRERLRALVDTVTDYRLDYAATALHALADPVLRAFLEAPEDDEPLTDEDRAAIGEGRADVERGDVVRWEDYDPDRRARA